MPDGPIRASWDIGGTKYQAEFPDIQGAIDGLPATGGVVQIPSGTWVLTTGLTVPTTNPIHLIGAGSATILTTTDNTMTMVDADNTSRFLISDLRFTGTPSEAISVASATNPGLSNLRIELTSGTAIDTTGTTNISYNNVWNGTTLLNSGGVGAAANFDSITLDVANQDVVLDRGGANILRLATGDDFNPQTTGQNLGSASARWDGVFDTVTTGQWNGIRVVDGNKFTTIQAAITDLGSNGMVLVPAGTYVESITIPGHNITLMGVSKTGCIITPAVGATAAVSASALRQNFRMSNISIGINAGSTNQIGIDFTNFSYSIFEHIDIDMNSATTPTGVYATGTASGTSPFYNLFSAVSIGGGVTTSGFGYNLEFNAGLNRAPNETTIIGGRVATSTTGIKLDGEGNVVLGTTIESVSGTHIDFGTATANSAHSNIVIGTRHEGTAAAVAATFAAGANSNVLITGRMTSISATKYTDSGSNNWIVTADGGQTAKFPYRINFTGDRIGFYNTTPVVKPTVTGSRGGNAALASLLTALAGQGQITDSTTA